MMWKSPLQASVSSEKNSAPPFNRSHSDTTPAFLYEFLSNGSEKTSPFSVGSFTSRTSSPLRRPSSRWGEAKSEDSVTANNFYAPGRVLLKAPLDNQTIRKRLEEVNLNLTSLSSEPRPHSPNIPDIVDYHYLKLLEDERSSIASSARRIDGTPNPQSSTQFPKRIARPFEKVYIPVKEFPDINFFGLLVGPRGNSLKRMERDSGAKISIRGKGSVKEGKSRQDQSEDADEDLHCLVLADTEEKVIACVKMINKVIETAASTPEGQNDHKRNQLRELAALNGTLRDDENHVCQNCGSAGHRKYDCPDHRSFASHIICHACGGSGHIARDCVLAQTKDNNIASHSNNSSLTNSLNRFDSLCIKITGESLVPSMESSLATSDSDLPNVCDSSAHPWSYDSTWQSSQVSGPELNGSDFSLNGDQSTLETQVQDQDQQLPWTNASSVSIIQNPNYPQAQPYFSSSKPFGAL